VVARPFAFFANIVFGRQRWQNLLNASRALIDVFDRFLDLRRLHLINSSCFLEDFDVRVVRTTILPSSSSTDDEGEPSLHAAILPWTRDGTPWRIGRGGITFFNATSTYGRFRRFNVQTDEKIR
jgi:hypothetical protein